MFPGPTVHANAGDTLVIQVTSKVASPVSIHWYLIASFELNFINFVSLKDII
jgi:FtsP/CotA-like multicopper oxidase with cupredoxin domain